tara:strand:- start:77 stop:457 length:381 start_codon:yes stop_codon:yes gene_type:complete
LRTAQLKWSFAYLNTSQGVTMVHRLETDDEYFAIQEIKEKLENARNAIKHASDNLRQLETVEIDAANQIMMHQTNRNALKDKGDILISFNKAQQAILETTQIMQSHQENTIRWRKEMSDIVNSMFL